jgi:hypothetical protein
MSKNSIPSIWAAQEKVLHLYQFLVIGLGIFGTMMVLTLIVQNYRNPIVVVRSQGDQEFYPTERKRAPLEKADIELFTKRFLASLYVWNEFNGEKLNHEVTPFAEAGLVQKIIDAQNSKFSKELKGKHLAQAITFVRVELFDDRVVSKFDRILKIEGIPLVIPTEVTLSMIQGTPTRLNPMGIYVSGITEADGAK